MTETVAAVLGVGAGSIATIGTQGTLAWLNRRNEARTAARLLYGDILEARDMLLSALQAGAWSGRRDLAFVNESWRSHREGVARALGSRDFHDVAGAFKHVELIDVIRQRNAAAADEGFAVAYPKLEVAVGQCDDARLILARAGCSGLERWITVRPKAGKREVDIAPPA